MISYLELLEKVLEDGEYRADRTGVGTYSLFGESFYCDFDDGFPLLTTKKMAWNSIAHELIWFLKGTTDPQYLIDNDVKIWNPWIDYYPVGGRPRLMVPYGLLWKYQLPKVIEDIKYDPYSRRHIVSAWNPDGMDLYALPSCHVLYQFYVDKYNELHTNLYQRSGDIFLGVPFNIASYSLLTYMVASLTGKKPGSLRIFFGDLHLYQNHIEQAKLQLDRDPLILPELSIDPQKDIKDFRIEHLHLKNYYSHRKITAPLAV